MIHILTIAALIFSYVKLKLCMRSSNPFISTRLFLTHKTLMMSHFRGSSKYQLTLPQGVFFFSSCYFSNYSGTFFFLFVFILLKDFFLPAEHISIKVSFFLDRKMGKGNSDFGCVVLFFPFQFPHVWK